MGHPMCDFIEATRYGLREHRCWQGWWGALRSVMVAAVIGCVDSSGDVDALSPTANDLSPPAKTCHDLPRTVSFDRSFSRGTSRWTWGVESGTVVDLSSGVEVRADRVACEDLFSSRRSSRKRGRPDRRACHRLPYHQNGRLRGDQSCFACRPRGTGGSESE